MNELMLVGAAYLVIMLIGWRLNDIHKRLLELEHICDCIRAWCRAYEQTHRCETCKRFHSCE